MKKNKKVFCFSNTTNYLIAFVFFGFQVFGQSITVNSTNYKQTIDMIGGDMERSSIAVQKAQNKEEIFQWSFGDINFNVCRVQYDKNQELTEGVKNWSFYEKQVATMKAIKTINPAIKFFATMRSDYDGFGDDNNMPDWIHTYSTKATNVEKYGIFLADYCEYMSQQGVPISILSTAKEWMWHVRASEAEEIIHTLNTELTNRGVEIPLIIDQGFWSLSAGITYLNNVASLETKDLYSAFCSHNYGNEAPDKWVEIIEKSTVLGKSMYDDETSTGSGSPTYGEEREMYKQVAEYIKKAERYKAGLNGEIFFEIWSRGIDKETRAIYYPAKGTGKRLRGYYMMKQFSNNILDHTYVTSSINDMSNVYTISFRKEDKIVLWVINKGDTEYTLPVKIDKSTITSQVKTHYWTNNTPIEGAQTTYAASGNTFTPTVAGESMNCYVFEVTEEDVDVCNTTKTSLIEAECYDEMSGIATESSTEGTDNISNIDNGDWIKFENLDLGSGVKQFSVRVASNTAGGNIELRTGSETGLLFGTLAVSNTGNWQNYKTVSTEIEKLSGIQDVYLVFTGETGNLFNLNWLKLEAMPSSVLVNVTTGNKSVTLDWTLENMEVASQKIYRNTFLSETNRTLIAENLSGTNYTDTNVSNGETYWYWVEATDVFSKVSISNAIEVTPTIPNLALASRGSIATQSSTAYNGPPELAIDGNTDGSFGNGSVTHTAHTDNPKWWQVDLQGDYSIENVIIYNRTGSNYGERLSDFSVDVIAANGNITFTQVYEDYPNPSMSISFGGVVGSLVRISKTSDNGLTLAEVEVYGEDKMLNIEGFEKSNVQIYPNPVKDFFTITHCENAEIEIYSTLGKLIYNNRIERNIEQIEMKTFKKGLYYIKIKNQGVISVKKIRKE